MEIQVESLFEDHAIKVIQDDFVLEHDSDMLQTDLKAYDL